MLLTREFFERDTLTVAKELLGKRLVREADGIITSGIIVETEAYLGERDRAAHSYRGKTERVRVLYGEKGLSYIYFTYGIYWCMNISTGPAGVPECVLIRALHPDGGLETMSTRRGGKSGTQLCSGPGKLCQAMDITGELYGADLCCPSSPLRIEDGNAPLKIVETTRIGIENSGEAASYPWRFYSHGDANVSKIIR